MESPNGGSYSTGLTEVRSDLEGSTAEGGEEAVHMVESSQEQVPENGLASETACIDSIEMRDDSRQGMRRILQETAANFLYREIPQSNAEDHGSVLDVEPSIQQANTRDDNVDVGLLLDRSGSFQDSDLENVDPQESNSHEEMNEGLSMGAESHDRHEFGFQHDEWENSIEEDIDETQLENISTNWSGEFLSTTTYRGDMHLQNAPEASHENVIFVEDVPNWLEGPNQEATSSRRLETFYFPEDDNVHNGEIRELLNRY